MTGKVCRLLPKCLPSYNKLPNTFTLPSTFSVSPAKCNLYPNENRVDAVEKSLILVFSIYRLFIQEETTVNSHLIEMCGVHIVIKH